MPYLSEVTCDNCGAKVDPRQVKSVSTRSHYGAAVDNLTRFERDSIVREEHWTFDTPCPSCGTVGWTITGYAHTLEDRR